MQELAKAQRPEAPPVKPAPEPRTSTTKTRLEDKGAPPTHPAFRRPSAGAIPQPPPSAAPDKSVSWISRITDQQRFKQFAIGAVIVLAIAAVVLSGPTFQEGMYPMAVDGAPRPLPLNPNVNITTAFGTLGTRSPKANPDSPQLARYTYGSDLSVDALNGVIYAITVKIPNRSWRGLHAGMNEQTANGVLALLGIPTEGVAAAPSPPQEMGGYWVYPSLDERPRRTISVEVRPPNGCYDIQVELQPQAYGTLDGGDRRYAVVGLDGPTLTWVVTQVRVVSRSLRGPYSGVPAC